MTARVDENGWWIGPLSPLDRACSWSLFSPEPSARWPTERVEYQARRFFSASLRLHGPKHYPEGSWPRFDVVNLSCNGHPLTLRTMPIEAAPTLLKQAQHAAQAMGGAGMDVVLGRARRLWQVETAGSESLPSALTTLAVLASLWLGPILPPDEDRLLGVKGARERLDKATEPQP